MFIERLWRSVKYEKLRLWSYETVQEASELVSDWMEFYNHRRSHTAQGGLSTNQKSRLKQPLKIAPAESARSSIKPRIYWLQKRDHFTAKIPTCFPIFGDVAIDRFMTNLHVVEGKFSAHLIRAMFTEHPCVYFNLDDFAAASLLRCSAHRKVVGLLRSIATLPAITGNFLTHGRLAEADSLANFSLAD